MLKDGLGNLHGTPYTHLQITTDTHVIVVQKSDNTAISCVPDINPTLIGRELYVAGKNIIDVKAAAPVAELGKVSRTERQWLENV